MYLSYRYFFLLFLSYAYTANESSAQAAYLSLQSGTGADTLLAGRNTEGMLRRRFYTDTAIPYGNLRWSWYAGNASGADTMRSWRPGIGSRSIPGFNQLVFPDTGNTVASALFSDSGGAPGLVPGIRAGTWLSWHIGLRSKPSLPVDEWMLVCTTNYRPAEIVSWSSPDTVAAGANPCVRVVLDRRLSNSEWAGIEFDTTASLVTARRLRMEASDSTATGFMPCFRAGQRVWFRLFTSCVPIAQMDSLFLAHGTLASRLLSLTETGRLTDSIRVLQSTGLYGDYLIPGPCFTGLQPFVDSLNRCGLAGAVRCHVRAGYREKLLSGSGLRLLVAGDSLKPLHFGAWGNGPKPLLIAGTGTRSMNSSSSRIDGIWSVHGTDHLNIEGFELVDSNSAMSGSARMEYGFALFKDSLNGGCRKVRIAHCKVRFLSIMNSAGPTAFEDGNKGFALINARAESLNLGFPVGGPVDQHQAIRLEYDTVSGAYAGILAKGMSDNQSPYRRLDSALHVSRCAIWNFGEEGIKVMNVRNAVVEGNHIHSHPHSSLPASVPAAERFGIVFTSGHLFSEAGIHIADNRITVVGRALSGTQHVFGIALRQNAGTTNRMVVSGNTITGCGSLMANSTFYGIRNTGQRHSLLLEANQIHLNRSRGTTGHAIGISNTGQIHQWLRFRGNNLGCDTVSGDYTGISHVGQARWLEATGNVVDSIRAGSRAAAILLHSNGQSIRADSNRMRCLVAGMGIGALSVRGTAVTGTTRCSIRGNAIHLLRADSLGAVIGLELNTGLRHQAGIHANSVGALQGNGRIVAFSIRTAESDLSNNRIALLDGLPGSSAQISGMELHPGLAVVQHNTIYLRGSHADSLVAPVALRWSDSSGSRIRLQNNVLAVAGEGAWRMPIAFQKAGSGLDTLRIHPLSAGNFFHASGSLGRSWLYFNRTDNRGDSFACDLFGSFQANDLPQLANGGSGYVRLAEDLQHAAFLRSKTGWHWPSAVNGILGIDAAGKPRQAGVSQVPGAMNDTFSLLLDRQYAFTAAFDSTPLYAPASGVVLAEWAIRSTAAMPGAALRAIAVAPDTALLADSFALWVAQDRDSAFQAFGQLQRTAGIMVFKDSLWLSCLDTAWFRLTASLACSARRIDTSVIRLSYMKTDTDSFPGTEAHAVYRWTPRNRSAVSIAGADTVCPGQAVLWKRRGGRLEPAGNWLWYDTGKDSLLGTGDSLRLQLNQSRMLMLRGAGQCDTTPPVYQMVSLYAKPMVPQRIRADRDTLCRGVANWFYPLGGSKGSGGRWAWYAGQTADTFLQTGDALQFAIQQPDTLYLRAEAYCGNSDWVKLPLAIRNAGPYDWIGSDSNNWHNKANWCSEIPGKGDTVYVRKAAFRMPRIMKTATVGMLALDTGAQLALDSGVRLYVFGGLQAEGGQLSGSRATLVCAATDTAEWALPEKLDIDTLLMDGVALRLTERITCKHLVLEKGLLMAAGDTLELETPAQAGKNNHQFSASWIQGPFIQRVGSDSLLTLPCGDALYPMPVSLQFLRARGLRRLLVQYRDRPGSDSGLNASEFGIGFNFIAGKGAWFLQPEPDTAIALYQLKLWFDGHPDYMHHLQDGSFTILRRNDSSRRALDWEIPSGSSFPGRDSLGTRVSDGFALRKGLSGFSQFAVAGSAAVLPLGFRNISLKMLPNSSALLQWQMEPALAFSHFVVQQSEGADWVNAGRVMADHASPDMHYHFRIPALLPGRHFFRIRAYAGEAHVSTSPIRFADVHPNPELEVYPNPFSDWLEVRLPGNGLQNPAVLELMDIQGRCVHRVHIHKAQNFRIDTRNLVAGWYNLLLRSQESGHAMRVPVFRAMEH